MKKAIDNHFEKKLTPQKAFCMIEHGFYNNNLFKQHIGRIDMQISFQRTMSLSLLFALGATSVTPAIQSVECSKTTKKIIGSTLFFTALVSFVRLVTKETKKERVYPQDDSIKELAWYFFDELLTGQMKKDKKAKKLVVDPENPEELIIQYEGVEARGLMGTLYSAMKPVIIPALTLMLIFNKEFKEKVRDGVLDARIFMEDPTIAFDCIWQAITTNDPKQMKADVTKPASVKV